MVLPIAQTNNSPLNLWDGRPARLLYFPSDINSGDTGMTSEETAVPCPYPKYCRDKALSSPNFFRSISCSIDPDRP